MTLPKRQTYIVHNQLVSVIDCAPKGEIKGVVLILHGWRSEASIWNNVMGDLCEKGYHCIAPDLPGFGLSEAPRKDFVVDDYVDVVYEVIDRMNVSNVVVVGHSFGARVAIKMSLRSNASSVLRGLILIGAAGVSLYKKRTSIISTIAHTVRPLFMLPLLRDLRPYIYRLIGSEDYLASPELKQTFRNILSEDLEPLLDKISLPTTLVWGANDDETPLKAGEIMYRKIRGSHLLVIDDAGHYVFLDHREEVVEEILRFLTEIEGS
jgi:pimeloyl-ACP methyl ester carboxylesterase